MKVKINWGKIQRTTPFFVDLQFVLKILDRCSMSSKVHSHETIRDKNDCDPRAFFP